MPKLISSLAMVSPKATLEYPVRVFSYACIQRGAEIGRYSYINRHSFVQARVRMGRYCSISRAVDIGAVNHPMDFLSTHPFQYNRLHFDEVPGYTDSAPIIKRRSPETHIGHDVLMGAKTVVLAGVTIGTGAIIGANSFVNKDVPPYAIVAGSPAKIIRYRFDEETIDRLLRSDWWELEPHEMTEITFDQIDVALEQIRSALIKKRADVLLDAETKTAVVEPTRPTVKASTPS